MNYNEYITACSLMVTEQCNLRCTYCFETHNNNFMSLFTVKNSIDFLCLNAVRANRDVSITFFGGEPTLNPDAIIYAIEYGQETAHKLGIRINYGIITNCVQLPEKLELFLLDNFKDINMSVQLSIDGVQEVQDRYRITRNGKASYHLVKETFEKWKKIALTKSPNIADSLNIHGCINRETLPRLYENFLHFIEDFGVDNTWFLPVAEENWIEEDVQTYLEQTTKMIAYIKKKAKDTNDISYLRRHAPFDRRNCMGDISRKPCGAGDSYCSITAQGLIYPCHQFLFIDKHQELCLGDVFEKDINESIRRFFVDYDGKDLTCDPNCTNGDCYRCIAGNFAHQKSCLAQTQGIYCKFMTIDRLHQLDLKKMEEEHMGLTNRNNCDSNMMCTNHTSETTSGCDVVTKNHDDCECGGNCSCGSDNSKEVLETLLRSQLVITQTLKEILDTINKE